MDYGSFLNFLSAQKTPMQTFMDSMKQGAEQRSKEAEAKYHEGLLANEQQKLAQEKEFGPLKLNLLRAQVEAHKALANQRNRNASLAGGLTKANLTKNQGIIQSIENVTPLIEGLADKNYDVPNQVWGQYLHPEQQVNYKAKTGAITDSLIAAMGLPKTNESIHLVNTMVERGKAESAEAYRKRLTELKQDLANRKQRAHQAIKSGLTDYSDPEANAAQPDFSYDENGNLLGS